MGKRKKKWQRGPRNSGITVVFAADTRKAIEIRAIEEGSPKSVVIAQLVESALGIVRTTVATNPGPREVEAAVIDLPDGSRVYGTPKNWTDAQRQAFMDQHQEEESNPQDTPAAPSPQESQPIALESLAPIPLPLPAAPARIHPTLDESKAAESAASAPAKPDAPAVQFPDESGPDLAPPGFKVPTGLIRG